ncbi:MAG: hypothetical protein AAF526_13240 [Pseudomonadota bacterium]
MAHPAAGSDLEMSPIRIENAIGGATIDRRAPRVPRPVLTSGSIAETTGASPRTAATLPLGCSAQGAASGHRLTEEG